MGIRRGVAVSFALTASLLLALSGAVPALAHSRPAPRLSLPGGLSFAGPGKATSTIAGGWKFGVKAAATSVTTEFTVPALTCTSTTSGLGPIVVMTNGTSAATAQFNAAGLLMECIGGTPAAEALVVVNGGETPGPSTVAAGDLIRSTVILSAKGITARVDDLTAGHAFKFKQSGTGAPALTEEIIDDSLVNTSTGQQLPMANFGKIEFTRARVGGQPIGSVSPGTKMNMVNTHQQLQIRTGWIIPAEKIHPNNTNTFRTHWVHQ